jgi:uncharacterized repeat protein (TIGR01451 family)
MFKAKSFRAFIALLAALSAIALPAVAAAPPVFSTAVEISPAKGAPSTEGRMPTAVTRPASYAPTTFAQGYQGDVEPNGTPATATPLVGTNLVVRGNIFPATDQDFYSFQATANDRFYAATMTSFSGGNSTDSQLTLLDQDGVTVLEFDDDSGIMAGLSSVIAGTVIPATGTYFIKVNDFTAATGMEKPYELHFRLQSGAPTPEVEANDTPATANPLPANGWVSGARNPAAATEQDWFSFTMNAGDTAYLTLDLDPEDDLVVWNGRLGIALFGDATNQILPADDAGTSDTGSTPPTTNRPAEAIFMTAKTAGTYFAFVDSATAATGGPTATYHLSVSVHPATNEGVNCTTYTSTDVPKTIGPGNTLVSSTITVPGNPRIADLDVDIVLNHVLMTEIDAHLRSPAGNDTGLFTDIGSNALGGQAQMDTVYDDEAGVTPFFTALRNLQYKPEVAYRLDWFDGENAGGVWTLDLRDDVNNANGGTLTAWSLRICEPPPPPACAPGFVPTTVFSTDFESGAAGFTHSGTLDEWELGLPATLATSTANPPPLAAFNTCNSGVNCWKTDLDGAYELNSVQNLLSPAINLAGLSAPVVVTWAQRYQMENASFDHYNVNLQQVGGATPVRLFEWLGTTMTDAPGNPAVNIGTTAGWGNFSRRADSLAGLNTELLFHVDSDNTVVVAGVAIDDVSVTACRPATADLSITKTDGVTTAVPGGSVTYTITASNAGTDPATGTVADTFPAILTCNWTCVGAGGGTCTAGPVAGNINDPVSLPVGASVTYTASCTVAASATGSLANTATVSSAVSDPNPANNSATDTDTLDVQYNLGITKTDGSATEVPGTPVTYTIVASNPGPSNATGVTVADTFPASLSGCSTTCAGAGGGTCTAGPFAGNINDAVNLPAGGSAIYTSTCNIDPSATGTLSNTATVTGGDETDPSDNSATDVDNLTPQVDVSVTKTDGAATEVPGTPVTYTIVATNSGRSNATGVTVVDNFPAALSGCSTTCVGAGGGTCTAGPTAGNINDVANLPVGASVTYTATCNIASTATGNLTNTVTVNATGDQNPANDSATDTDTLAPEGDLAITKTDGQTNNTAGQPIVYTIVVSNTAGPSAVTGATVADNFPAGVTGASWTCAGAGGGTCTAGPVAGNINDLVNLPVGGSVTYTVNGTIDAGFSGTLTNTATVTAPGGFTDPNPPNNSATDQTTVAALGNAMVVGEKTVDGDFAPGGTIFYTIVLTNNGTAAQGDNPGDEFTDILPAGLTLVSVSATSGTATSAGNTAFWNGSLAPAASVTITIEATIDPGTTGQIVNQGTISYDSDGDGDNDATGVTDDPTVPGGGNGTSFGVGQPVVEVPTLSDLALLLLGLALAIVGLRQLYGRG